MVVHKHIYKAIAPIFIGALVFCCISVFGQDYYYKGNTRGASLDNVEGYLLTSLNYYLREEQTLVQGQFAILDNTKKEQVNVTLNKTAGLSIVDLKKYNNSYYISGTTWSDDGSGYSKLILAKFDSCFVVEWAKVLETDEPDRYQVDYPVSKIYILNDDIYAFGACTFRKNFIWNPYNLNRQTSTIWKFKLDGSLAMSTPIFTNFNRVSPSGMIDTLDTVHLIQFSHSIYPRILDQGENGWRGRPLYTIVDSNLNIIKQQAFHHFSDTTGSFQAHLRLDDNESLFGGFNYPRPHAYSIRNSIPFIAKVNTTTGELLFTKNFNGYNERRKDGYVSDFLENKRGTVAIVTTMINDRNGEIFDTSSISFVQFDTAFNELKTHEFRPINKELKYVDHTMYNDSIMYLLASIATRPENGVVYRSESAIFKVNVNTFEVLDWDSVGTPMDSFCSSEVIYEDGDIDFEPFYINRNYVDSSLLSVAEIESKIISVYPNPAKNILKTKANLQGFDYRIINLLGAELVAGKFENEIDVSVLQVGLYILELSDNHIVYRARFYKE
jgi:hypothetical protein